MRDALAELPIPPRLLTALLILLAALTAPHLANLSAAVPGFFYVAVVWRLLAIRHPAWMPSRWTLLLLMLMAIALVVTSTGLADGRLAGTALLVVMLGLKLLELRARRDIHVTVFLGYFLILTQFLYNQSLWLALYLFPGVIALIGIQVGLNRARVVARGQLGQTLKMVAAALPLAIVVFLLFPRLQTPLWGINAPVARTGISDRMTLGDIGRLSRSTETAFRVRFLDDVPEPQERYWRGPVLWQTDGRTWTAGSGAPRPITPDRAGPSALDYEVTLEPTGEYWVFGLDVATETPPGTRLNADYALVGEQRINRRFTYRATSDPEFVIDHLSRRQRERALQLPETVSPRVRELAEQWRRETDPSRPMQLIDQALAYFREQPFVYTLTPGSLQGDPIDGFLFDSRRGFCEHYAGSFTLLMRLAGLPARVVVGYQGGEQNPRADHWVIRQSDAHAWSEVWLPGHGWWRVDPTAAVSPERIEQSIDPAGSGDRGEVRFQIDADGFLHGLVREAGWLVDAVDIGWHRWIVGFTAERQRSLLELVGLRDLRGFGLALALLAGGAFAGLLAYLIYRVPGRRRGDPLPDLWQRYRRKLHRAGLEIAGWQGPETLCEHAIARYPRQAQELTAITRLFVQLRYGRHYDARQFDALRRRIARLRLRNTRPTQPVTKF
jgi:transglutaminase-like putative cysteine protease